MSHGHLILFAAGNALGIQFPYVLVTEKNNV